MNNKEYIQETISKDTTLTQYMKYEKTLEKMERIISETKPWQDNYETLTKEYLQVREEYNKWLEQTQA